MLEQFIQATGKVAEAVANANVLSMIKSDFDKVPGAAAELGAEAFRGPHPLQLE